MDIICEQNYDGATDELIDNCTVAELNKIIDHLDVTKRDEEESSNSDLAEDIVNVKRENTLLNTTYLVDRFCLEQKLVILENELIASCTGKRIKELYTELTDKNFYDISCYQCIDKTEFVKAVVEVKRRHYDEVRILSMMRKLCVKPELSVLTQKLNDRCTGGEIKSILEEILGQGSSPCVEKAECIDEVIEMKRRNFKEIEIIFSIYKFCIKNNQ